MSAITPLLQLHDLDLLLREVRESVSRGRLQRMGFGVPEPGAPERARVRLLAGVDRRWLSHYERARERYTRAVVAVRDRVCLGCHVTLPTSASPGAGETLTLCESCGRILYWR
jgi:hypothetical protein